jgi:hypothetical protein
MTARAATLASPDSDTLLLVEALTLVRYGLPGPALSGRTGVELIASVLHTDGTPATRLSTEAFDIHIVAGPGVTAGTDVLPIRTMRETMPGIYTLAIEASPRDEPHHERRILALTVRGSGRQQGRALVRIDH